MQHEHPDESASAHDKIHCAIARSKNYACTRCEIEARESSALWFLNIEVRDDQIEILNPKQRDVQEAMIIEQSYGEAAKKKEARRRIDIILGNA